MIHGRHLTVFEEDYVSEMIAAASLEYERAEEVFASLVLRISRQPECGDLVQDNGIDYRLVINKPLKLAKNPMILVRYRTHIEGESLIIDWVKVYPYDESQAYSPAAFDLNV